MAKRYQTQNVSDAGVEKPEFLGSWALLGQLIKKINETACLLLQCLSRIKICSCIFFLGLFVMLSIPSGIDNQRSPFSLYTKFHIPYFSSKGTYIKQVTGAISPSTSDIPIALFFLKANSLLLSVKLNAESSICQGTHSTEENEHFPTNLDLF